MRAECHSDSGVTALTWATLAHVKEVHCHACSEELAGSCDASDACPWKAEREAQHMHSKAPLSSTIIACRRSAVPMTAKVACSCEDETVRLLIAATNLDRCAGRLPRK
jgi:hypothetical protein